MSCPALPWRDPLTNGSGRGPLPLVAVNGPSAAFSACVLKHSEPPCFTLAHIGRLRSFDAIPLPRRPRLVTAEARRPALLRAFPSRRRLSQADYNIRLSLPRHDFHIRPRLAPTHCCPPGCRPRTIHPVSSSPLAKSCARPHVRRLLGSSLTVCNSPAVPTAQALAFQVGDSITQVYDLAEKGVGDITGAVWKRIKRDETPKCPGWKQSLRNALFAVSCECMRAPTPLPRAQARRRDERLACCSAPRVGRALERRVLGPQHDLCS